MTRQIVAVLLVSAFAGACDESENHGTTQILVQQTNLTSDQPGVAAHTDPNLVNAWGLAVNPNVSPPVFWISAAQRTASNTPVVESSTGTTKQAASWPSGRPAFISVGELGRNSRADIIRSKVRAAAATSSAPARSRSV